MTRPFDSVSIYRKEDGSQLELVTDKRPRQQQALPLITSSCPAVVFLLEKSTHAVVPHLSTTKSSMEAVAAAYNNNGMFNNWRMGQ